MTRIVQIAPAIRPGSGVEGVAYQLEEQFLAFGVATERFTLTEAGGAWLRLPEQELARKAVTALRVLWFSTVGTVRCRRFLAERPDAVSICHNDVLAGDIYVNHGIVVQAMRARGHHVYRMVRNPIHLFTWARDSIRYASGVHRVVVSLTEGERELLHRTYSRVGPEAVVIPNGVDTDRFRPASPEDRAVIRAELGVQEDHMVAVFVGHEFERKGLPLVLEALQGLPGFDLVVVGGSADMVRAASRRAEALGTAARVRFVGRQADPVPYLHAADVFVLPSAYEANALVVLEALACGLPVVATRVGFAPDIIVDGRNGYLVDRDAVDIARRLECFVPSERSAWRLRARQTAERFSWSVVARQYLDLVVRLEPGKEAP